MSYYLTYRPQTVEELDLASVRESLQTVLKSGKFAHAYLFTGPKGTGKTSSARILAKVLNCEKNKKVIQNLKTKENSGKGASLQEPCGECGSCVGIMKGSSLAVMEMDAASNRGIDDIRSLRERVGLAPAEGEMVVYVIDEVHMLTTEAFNALLKTLEEPPEHVVFVLATTEAHKVPDTIKSRCTRILFQKATAEEVVRSLNKAVKGEGLKIDKKALEAIAERVDGSFRDGVKILEQLSGTGEAIELEDVDALTGFSDDYEVVGLIDVMKAKDVQRGLEILQDKEMKGVDFSVLARRWLEEVRQELLSKVVEGGDEAEVAELRQMAEMIAKGVGQMKGAVIVQLPLELVVVEWCIGGRRSEIGGRGGSGLKTGLKEDSKSRNEGDPSTAKRPTGALRAQDDTLDLKSVSSVSNEAESTVISKSNSQEQKAKSSVSLKLDAVVAAWPGLMRAVKPHNHSLEALLRAAEPAECEGGRLVLNVFYTFHKEQLEQERHRVILEEVFSSELKAPVRLEFVLGNKAKAAPVKTDDVTVNVTGKVGDEELAAAAEEIFGG